MATISKAYEALVLDLLGMVPTGLSAAIAPLTAEQRNRFTLAYYLAPEEQRRQPATSWVLPEDDRMTFDTFRLSLLDLEV